MRRTPVALTTGAAVVAAVAMVATSGSAQAPAPAPTTLHFVGKSQKHVGFGPHHKPRQGDRFGFGDTVTGDDTGIDRGICTVIGVQQGVCTVSLRLSKGTFAAQGIVNFAGKAKNNPFAVTGGTGAYDGARGTALVTDVSDTVTDVNVTLLP